MRAIRALQTSAGNLNRRGRIILVGTTPLRALESASRFPGRVDPCSGYTSLRIHRGYPLKVVKGLLTGLHEPETSHLDLLRAFLNEERLSKQYNEALKLRYR